MPACGINVFLTPRKRLMHLVLRRASERGWGLHLTFTVYQSTYENLEGRGSIVRLPQ
jgi:hypothetical protein